MTQLQQLSPSQVSPELPLNENFETLAAAAIFGKRHPATSGLTWGYYGGLFNGNTIADGTVTLTDSATNYVVVLRSTGVVSASTSSANSLNSLYAKLYSLTTVAGAVTATVDQRMDANGLLAGGAGGGGSGGGTELKGLTFTSDTSSIADSDPGLGKFRWNNATEASATVLFLDNQTADGVSLTTFYASLGTAGFIYMQQADDSTRWQLWKWAGAPVDGTGYRKFTVSLQAASASAIVTGKVVDCDFSSLGGVGDASTNTASSVDGEAVLFSGTAGKTLKRATGTGYAKRTSGVETVDSTTTVRTDLQGTGLNAGEVGFRNIPQNSQSADYTAVAADAGGHLLHPSADTTARTFTIPANASVAYPVGTALTFVNQNAAGVMTIAITTDTMRLAGAGTTGSRTLAANGLATALKITTTEWVISGPGLT